MISNKKSAWRQAFLNEIEDLLLVLLFKFLLPLYFIYQYTNFIFNFIFLVFYQITIDIIYQYHPLQCSCMENHRDGWAVISGVAQSRTWLKGLSSSIYSFLLVRYSTPLSAGVLHALPCLKVCSWYIHGERWAPCLPTPLLFTTWNSSCLDSLI
jgi:hypothetical protein